MRNMFAIIAAVLLGVSGAAAQEKPAAMRNDAAEKLLIAQERALLEAIAKADKTAFEALVLPGGTWTAKDGFIPTDLLADGLSSFNIEKWDIVNPRVTWLDQDSAVLLYTWSGRGRFADQPLASMMVASTVWTKRNDKWLAAHHHQSDLLKD